MKRTLASITTIVIALGLAITGVSTASAEDSVTPVAAGAATTGSPAVTDAPALAASESSTTPTPSPSAEPSAKPSAEPSAKPSAEPSAKPSAEPSAKSSSSYPSEAPTPSSSTTATAAQVYSASNGNCLPASAVSYTYSPGSNSGTVTVTARSYFSTLLCAPIFITATSWKYTKAAVWPQELHESNKVEVDRVGSYPYGATVSCGQGDIYAQTGSAIEPTQTLSGPQAWEKFLSGMGLRTGTPGNTYVQSPVECFPTHQLIVPAQVSFVDTCGVDGDKVVVPAVTTEDHYSYSTSDTTAEGVRTVTVTAVPNEGYGFSSTETTVWSHTFKTDAQNKCVKVPGDPESVGQTCAVSSEGVVSGYLTVAPVEGVVYTIHPVSPLGADITVVAPKTEVGPGDYSITAAAEPGYILSGVSEWPRTVARNSKNCGPVIDPPTLADLPSSVSWVSQTCSAGGTVSGYIAIDPTDFLSYFVGTTKLVSARTAFEPGTYVVTVVAPPGDTIDGPTSYTATITKPASSCGNLESQSLTTLAFTGFDSGAGYLAVASALLMLGAGLVFTARRRARA